MGVRAFIAQRLLFGILTILGVTLVLFLLLDVAGGNPVVQFLGKHATAEEIAALEALHGFNRHISIQYIDFVRQVVTFDLGHSFRTGEDVFDMFTRNIDATLSFTLPALVLGTVIAATLALVSVARRHERVARTIVLLSVFGMSLSFLIYILVGQVVFASKLGLVPVHGYAAGIAERWRYLALPIAILVVAGLGTDIEIHRAVFAEEIDRAHVHALVARGLSRRRVLFIHVVANAMIPAVTRVMMSVPFLVTGSVLLETFFGIPGVGSTLLSAIDAADFPVIRGYTVVIALLFVASNVATDILYAVVDPRVRLA